MMLEQVKEIRHTAVPRTMDYLDFDDSPSVSDDHLLLFGDCLGGEYFGTIRTPEESFSRRGMADQKVSTAPADLSGLSPSRT